MKTLRSTSVLLLLALVAGIAEAQPRVERPTYQLGDRWVRSDSRPAEVSIELPELGHGIFSYYLVNGLRGAADLNRDGIISLQELYEYLEQQVTSKARSVGGNQHPVMKGELEGVLPLTKVRGK